MLLTWHEGGELTIETVGRTISRLRQMIVIALHQRCSAHSGCRSIDGVGRGAAHRKILRRHNEAGVRIHDVPLETSFISCVTETGDAARGAVTRISGQL